MRTVRLSWPALVVVLMMVAACGRPPVTAEGDDSSSRGRDDGAPARARDNDSASTRDEEGQSHVLTTTLNLGSAGAAQDPRCEGQLGPYGLRIESVRRGDPSITVRLDNARGVSASSVELDISITVSEQPGPFSGKCGETTSMRSPVVAWTPLAGSARYADGSPMPRRESKGARRASPTVVLSPSASAEGTDDSSDAAAETGDPDSTSAPRASEEADAPMDDDSSPADDDVGPDQALTKPVALGARVADGYGTCTFTSSTRVASARCTLNAPTQGEARSVIVALPEPERYFPPDVTIGLGMRLR